MLTHLNKYNLALNTSIPSAFLLTMGRILPILTVVVLLLLLPATVVGECTCDAEESGLINRTLALRYKLAAIASILVASAIGVLLPVAAKSLPALSPDRSFFFVVKAFAAGVILSTGFIHVLPDAFESLTSPCLADSPWGDFPFAGFVAMVAAIGTLMVDTYATWFYSRRSRVKAAEEGGATAKVCADDVEGSGVPVHVHGHTHGPLDLNSGDTELLRHRVISQVLELGILVHSIIIGIALGASQRPGTIRPLIAALTFHQFFEGIGLGGCITQAKFKVKTITLMALFFSITTPSGIAIGIGITNNYSETSPTTLIIQGIFNSASTGILIYMALVDLLSADFMSPKMQANGNLQFWSNISLLLGAAFMSILAKWA